MALFGLFGGKPSKDEFAALVARKLQAAGFPHAVRYEKASFSLVAESGERSFNLENAFRYYCDAPKDQRERVLAEFFSSWSETATPIPASWAEASANVMPYVRPLNYFSLGALQLKVEGRELQTPPHRAIGGDLALYLAFDQPSTMATVDSSQLVTWGVGFEEAIARAADNLRKVSAEPFQLDSAGLYVSPWRGPYDCSRLALHELFRRLPLAGAPVAIAPNRDVLLITGAQDLKGLQRMGEIAADVLRQPRPLSGETLVLGEGGWSPFRLQHEVPEHRGLIELRYVTRAGTLEDQKRLLDALHEKTGEDVFVASHVVTKHNATGVFSSYTTWSEGVHSLLPEADLIAFYRPAAQETFVVPWDAARAIVGHRMKPLDLHPPRFEAAHSPDEGEYARLREKAA